MASSVYHQRAAVPATEDPAFIVRTFGQQQFFELAYSDGTRFVMDSPTTRVWGMWVQPLTIEDCATYFLGPVMGFILRRRGLTALHASAVCLSGHAVVFSGEAQAGKSTTAAALALRGIPILCEDISTVREDSKGFSIETGYPRVCLWPDAVKNLLGAEDALPRLTPNWEKCYLPLNGDLAKFEANSRPLGIIYILAPRSSAANVPRIEGLRQREALLQLVQNTYMNWLLSREQRAKEFDLLARILERVPVRRVVAPNNPEHLDGLCDLLCSDAESVLTRGN